MIDQILVRLCANINKTSFVLRLADNINLDKRYHMSLNLSKII
jgi:hypothetical protein